MNKATQDRLESEGYQVDESDNTIEDFFDSLRRRQEPLGKEFEDVLYDNLSDLYETDNDTKEAQGGN